jgi:hypothetical protein
MDPHTGSSFYLGTLGGEKDMRETSVDGRQLSFFFDKFHSSQETGKSPTATKESLELKMLRNSVRN